MDGNDYNSKIENNDDKDQAEPIRADFDYFYPYPFLPFVKPNHLGRSR